VEKILQLIDEKLQALREATEFGQAKASFSLTQMQPPTRLREGNSPMYRSGAPSKLLVPVKAMEYTSKRWRKR
jgi:hypothetical protein